MSREKDVSRTCYLQQLASACSDTCPPLSRFLLHTAGSGSEGNHAAQSMPSHMTCQSCGNLLLPGNHTVRLRPKRKMTSAVRRVISKVSKGQMASAAEVKLLKRYQDRKNHVIVQCTVCQGKAVIPAATRKHVVMATSASPGSLAGTPVVSRRIAKATRRLVSTPQSHSSPILSTPGSSMMVAGSSPRTPDSSLRVGSSGPGSSGRKGKHQKQRHAQLKHMLSQQSLGDTSISLSDFLQSL
ncbi:UPF0711 protein C18orf21 homolog [Branchiostoma floridae]|uniref:UPF0711 protein C18orf21 homolog n=1 Tax=Branchiostoma floridae TaxID=7739 RepID=A0A9J7KHD6_BRAFL|nr:UPF0711 protein C18orf21 homolog [Branchiostoma floridae]